MTLFQKKNLIKIFIAIFSFGMVILVFLSFPRAETITTSDLGVVSFVSSLPKNRDKQAMANKAQKAGFGWVREEFVYSKPMNYVPFDVAYDDIRDAGLNILGLLTYLGPNESLDTWRTYVSAVVERYPAVGAWEIMNEVDNHLTGADYVPYLKEAYTIIKAKSSAPVICSGLTSRAGVEKFWDDIAAAGGWGWCEGIGLHVYHNGDPHEDSNNKETLAQEIQQVVDDIDKNGGGKKIWVTEYGYDSNQYGTSDQAKWLVEGLKIMQGFPEVERIFVFRLYEHDDGLGLLSSSFEEKEAFGAVRDWLAQGAPAIAKSLSLKVSADQTKSSLRLDGENITADGEAQYRVVVAVKDAKGEIITDQKPSIILNGGQTVVTEPVLVGEEWFAYVASDEAGEKTAQIKVGETDLGTVKMVFGETVSEPVSQPVTPPVTITPTPAPPVTTTQPTVKTRPVTLSKTTSRPGYAPWIFIGIETLIISLILLVIWKLWQRSRVKIYL